MTPRARGDWSGTGAPPDPSVVLVDGPWRHRYLDTGGARLHAAEAGEGPLVLLLHGFPEFWWSWRHQLVALADAGYRAAAVDLRGFGASDKPRGGYDARTLAEDVAGAVRALGERDAVVVGHDWGGVLAWAVAALHPEVVRGLGVVAMPHPRLFRAALLRPWSPQVRASRYFVDLVAPGAEQRLRADGAARVGELLHGWGGPGFPDAETEERCREAALVPEVARAAPEYYRAAVRALGGPSGIGLVRDLSRPVRVPVLQLHGEDDPCVLASTARGSGRYVTHRSLPPVQELPGRGHFPHQEAPEEVTGPLLRLAAGQV